MTQTVLPLESYRLAQYAQPVTCYLCQQGNVFDAERCRACQAPMALTYQISSLKVEPRILAVLSSARAGKTSYLGIMTDLLSRQNEHMQLLARGAFSVALQQTAVCSLARGWFPPRTPEDPTYWNWVHCRIKLARRRAIELIIPDVANEVLDREIEHPRSQPMMRELLKRSSAALILLDAARLVGGDRQPDFDAVKAVSYLCELEKSRRSGWKRRPFALAFTKADQAEACFDDPEEFARRYTPGLWHQCQELLGNYNFFATSVTAGQAYQRELTGRRPIPLRVEPRGVVDPFAWLMTVLK